MLRKIVLLSTFMALFLCLLLGGCTQELPQEQKEALCGEWLFDRGMVEEMPFTVSLLPGGQVVWKSEKGMTWSATVVRDKNSYANVEIYKEGKPCYSLLVTKEDYDGIIRFEGNLKDHKGNYCATFARAQSTLNGLWAEKLCDTWHPAGWNEKKEEIIINKDGTCAVGDRQLRWCLDPHYYYGDDECGLMFYNDEGAVYAASVFRNGSGVVSMDLRTTGHMQDHVETYSASALFSEMAKDHVWYAFDRENPVTNYLYWDFYGLSFDGDQKRWQAGEVTDSLVTAFSPNAETPEYVLTASWKGAYPELELEITESGEKVYYYSDTYGYDPENPEALYCKAMDFIGYFQEGVTFWDGETDESYSGGKLLEEAYRMLRTIGDYRDAQSYRDRYTIVPDILTGGIKSTTDALGNVRTEELFGYTYDSEGRLIRFTDDATAALYGLTADGFPVHCYSTHIQYDENNRISDITVISHDNVYAKCTPGYDESGKLIWLHIQKVSSEFTVTYQYNDRGQCTNIQMENGSYSWYYNDAGQLVQSCLERKNSSVLCDYVYEDGILTRKVETHTNRSKSWINTYDFCCDEERKIISAAVVSTEPNYSYVSEERTYRYEDLYFYSAE